MTLLGFELSRRHLLLCALSLAGLAFVASSPQLLGDQVRTGFGGLEDATPAWLWLASAAFASALIAPACAWRAALGSCGTCISRTDASARYGLGSLVNSLAPAKLGTAVRLALYSRAIHAEGSVWTTGGIATLIGAVYALWLALLVAVGAMSGVLPLWPLLALGGAVLAAAAAVVLARRWHPAKRFGHVLDAFEALGRTPRTAAVLVGWMGLATAARIGGAAAVLTAFGVHHPLTLAVLVVPAVDLAGTLPLTPGNLGVTSAAVVFALKAHGIDADVGVAAGIGYSAVEAVASLGFGVASALYLAAGAPGARRWLIGLAGAAGCAAVAGAFSFTVLVPLA